MTIISDAPSCGNTSHDMYAPGVVTDAPREYL